MLKVKAHQVVYGLTRVEKCEKLQEFGQLLSRLQATYTDKDSGHYGLIVRVMGDQYTVLSSSKQVLGLLKRSPHPPCSLMMKRRPFAGKGRQGERIQCQPHRDLRTAI